MSRRSCTMFIGFKCGRERLFIFRRIHLHPPPDAAGIHFKATICRYLGYVFVRERIPTVPTHRQQDHLTRIVTSFEGIGRRHGHRSRPYQHSCMEFAMACFLNLGTRNLELLEVWKGSRSCSPDGLAFIGCSPKYDNLTIAACHAIDRSPVVADHRSTGIADVCWRETIDRPRASACEPLRLNSAGKEGVEP